MVATNDLGVLLASSVGGVGIGAVIRDYMRRKKTYAEADKTNADANLVQSQVSSEILEGAKLAISQIKEVLVVKDEQIHQLREEMSELRSDVRALSLENRRVHILLAAHGQWDLQVLSVVRRFEPDFPDAPPLHLLDKVVDNKDAL